MATSADFYSSQSVVTRNNCFDSTVLPEDVIARLRELEAELLDGDITEKGFVKKKNRLLETAVVVSSSITATTTSTNNNSKTNFTACAVISATASSNGSLQLHEEKNRYSNGNGDSIDLANNCHAAAATAIEEDGDEDADDDDNSSLDDDDSEKCNLDEEEEEEEGISTVPPAAAGDATAMMSSSYALKNTNYFASNNNNNSGSTATITLSCSKLKKNKLTAEHATASTDNNNNNRLQHHNVNGGRYRNGADVDVDFDGGGDDFADDGTLGEYSQLNASGSNSNGNGTTNSNSAELRSICHGQLEDNRYQSEIRTEAVKKLSNQFKAIHPSVSITGRGCRNRASSASFSAKQKFAAHANFVPYRRRKSASSAQETADVDIHVQQQAVAPACDAAHTVLDGGELCHPNTSDFVPPQPIVTPQQLQQQSRPRRGSSGTKRTTSTSSSTTSSACPTSAMSDGVPCDDESAVVAEQVPDIILDLQNLDTGTTNGSDRNHHQSTIGDTGTTAGSLHGSDESTDLQQLILSNFNSGTASLGHKKNKKGKGKKNLRAQQVMYLAGRGTNANELTRTTSGALCGGSASSSQTAAVTETPVFRGRVSTKIEQLARTLRRPKPRPLAEYFCDDSEILFADASRNRQPVTDAASRGQQQQQQQQQPEQYMSPLVMESLKLTSGIPLNPLFALFRYGSSSTYRSPAISVVESRTGKISQTVFYHKLLENSMKLAYALSHPKKIFQLSPSEQVSASSGGRHRAVIEPPKPGARVVLAYSMGDAISFATAFFACLLCGYVPVPIDPPSNTRREPFCQSIGIFVGAVGAEIVLTSFETFRNLAKDPQTGGVLPIKCWPNVTWLLFDQSIVTALAKPSKSWKPHVSPENSNNLESQNAFIQYSVNREGDVLPVSLTYDCMTKHIQGLAAGLGVVEGQLVVNLLDIKRDFGIWFSLLASVYYGMHVIQVSFSQVKADPMLWLRILTKQKPAVVVARSRDLYWTVLAHRAESMGHNAKSTKSLSTATTSSSSKPSKLDLSSVRQLIVADAANSWTVSPCESFIHQFATSGFKADAITPLAFSPECLTVSVRRPGHVIGDARLSLDALSMNSVQIDCSTLRCLALQDCGTPLPGTKLAVVKLSNFADVASTAELCKSDEIGEVCISRNQQCSPVYYDLPGQTAVTFKVQLNNPRPQQPPLNPGLPIEPYGEATQQLQQQNPPVHYARSGLFGFVSSTGSVFVVGSRELSIFTNCRRYSADDLSATILAVEPQNFVYRARLCVVPIKLARDERIVAVAEQNCQEFPTDSAAFAWMAKVIQAIDSLHNVSLYSLAVVQPGRLPRTPQGFINRHAVRRLFEDGHLHPTNILLCPHSAITNLPQPRLTPAAVHPSAQLLSNLLHGQRFAVAQGPSVTSTSSASMSGMAKSESFDSASAIVYNGHNTVSSCTSNGSTSHRLSTNMHPMNSMLHQQESAVFLPEKLRSLAHKDPDRVLFSFINQKGQPEIELTALQLHRRAERVACQLLEKARISAGDRVVILLPAPTPDFLAAVYGAFYVGCVPMVVRSPVAENLPATLSSCFLTVQICKPVCLLCSPAMARFFRSKEALRMLIPQQSSSTSTSSSSSSSSSNNKAAKKLPKIIAVDGSRSGSGSSSSKRLANIFRPQSLDLSLYIDLIVSTTGSLSGVRVSHGSALAVCRSVKTQAELYPSREILLAGLDPLSGFGFVMFALASLYAGHKTIVASLHEIENDPQCWLRCVSALQVRDAFVSPATLELCVRGFFQNPSTAPQLKDDDKAAISLTTLRSCTVVSEERPQSALISQFVKAFQSFGLQRRCVTAAFGCRMNVAVCLQPSNAPEPEQVHIDTKSLRNDRLAIVERGSPYAVCLTACGRVLPGVKVVVANAETRAQLGEDHLGELWVSSPHNTNGFFTVGGVTEGDADAASVLAPYDARFTARLETGDTATTFARTGFLGFIRAGSVFVIGPIEQSIFINNQRYQPCDLETTLQKLDPRRIPECAVFLASNLLVAVIEFDGPEAWALDLIPAATRCLLEAHQLIAGVVVIVEPGVVPLNSRGEKQRALLRDAFLADQLDPIYVSYNL